MKTEEVKKDLKNLKLYNQSVLKLKEVMDTHLMRIKMLERMEKNDKTEELIKKEQQLLSSLDFTRKIDQALFLESKYMETITSLDPLDRTIILDAYVNGLPYWKIGISLGYSEEGIRKKISKIIKNIALAM